MIEWQVDEGCGVLLAWRGNTWEPCDPIAVQQRLDVRGRNVAAEPFRIAAERLVGQVALRRRPSDWPEDWAKAAEAVGRDALDAAQLAGDMLAMHWEQEGAIFHPDRPLTLAQLATTPVSGWIAWGNTMRSVIKDWQGFA